LNETGRILCKKYFSEESFVKSDIESFNNFIDYGLQEIIDENKTIEPTIIPNNVESYKIKLNKIKIDMPQLIEADGSTRPVYPWEARLRKITYAAAMNLSMSVIIDGVQREEFNAYIGNMPIMLKSKYCHLSKMSRDELIEHGEDPDDPGGYFIINGSEKVLVKVEDLAPNIFMVTKSESGPSPYTGKIFSESAAFRIPHTIEKMKDGIFYLTFTRMRRVPVVLVIKALGLVRDQDIMKSISEDVQYDDVLVNLYQFAEITTPEDAMDYLAKKTGITQPREVRLQRIEEILDRFLLPHIGTTKQSRLAKAQNLCKMIKKFQMVSLGEIPADDKDHYANKRIKMSGDLLADLFRVNFNMLIKDMLYNFQRIVKRGKFPSLRVVIRDKLLTHRIYSSMATGSWVGNRKGISQRIQHLNYLETMSHLQRVVSPLSATQENFEARALHPTHLGRLCPIETPEGTNIGLKKNLALLASISQSAGEEELLKVLKEFGAKEQKLTYSQ